MYDEGSVSLSLLELGSTLAKKGGNENQVKTLNDIKLNVLLSRQAVLMQEVLDDSDEVNISKLENILSLEAKIEKLRDSNEQGVSPLACFEEVFRNLSGYVSQFESVLQVEEEKTHTTEQ